MIPHFYNPFTTITISGRKASENTVENGENAATYHFKSFLRSFCMHETIKQIIKTTFYYTPQNECFLLESACLSVRVSVCVQNTSSVKVLVGVLTLSQTTNFRLFQTERVCR